MLRRIARLADGWMAGGALRTPTSRLPQAPGGYAAMVGRLRDYARDAGRDPATVGLERRINFADGAPEWANAAAAWREIGGSHLSVNTMRAGLDSPRAHLEAIRRVHQVLVDAGVSGA
ncbi:MAG TPA: hypothetical protein VFP86_15245 [bacterium]|nr:hypothetical protein [bacterium]